MASDWRGLALCVSQATLSEIAHGFGAITNQENRGQANCVCCLTGLGVRFGWFDLNLNSLEL